MLRALVITGAMPVAQDEGAMTELAFDIESLQQLGYRISLVAANEMAARSAMLDKAKVKICGLPLYVTVEEVLSRQAGGFDVVYLPEEAVARRYLGLVEHHLPAARGRVQPRRVAATADGGGGLPGERVSRAYLRA